jgi:general secretion pathway protein D
MATQSRSSAPPATDATNPPSELGGSSAAPATDKADQVNAEIFPGNGGMLGHPLPRREHKVETSVGPQGDITLNFINADVKDVTKAILGDYLRLNYEIGSGVQGTVTIQTSQPLARGKVLAVLDQTLRLNGMALVYQNNIYKLVAIADAPHEAGAIISGATTSASGYGIEVAPVRYISAAEMQKLLEPLAPSQAIVHVDAARNVLIIEGTQQERETLLADIALFDADWLSGMSFALYTPNYMDANELTKELTQILGGMESPIGSIVKLVPIERLNAVLAISPQVKYLDQLKAWVARLDRPGQGSDKHIFIYHVQHGRAADLAGTLAKALFGRGGNSGSTGDTHASPPPPDILSAQPQGGSSGPSAPAAASSPTPVASSQGGGQFSGTLPGDSTSALGPVNITSDEASNALVIVASPQQYSAIQNALAQLDVAPLQVLLEAAIAEVTLTNNLSYGVQYYFAPGAQNSFTLSDTTSGTIAPSFPGFSYAFSGGNIKVILDALSTITKVDVLSSPQLMVLNNQTATLQVGDQVPIITQQAVDTQTAGAPVVNSVQYENTGVILQVTPRVNRGGEVMMDITQEVSDVSSTVQSSTGSPVIEQRKITSTVAVQDGETVTLGGLISKQNSSTKAGVPYLDEIPVLGNAFRDTTNGFTRTELLVLITPHVVDSLQKARAVTAELRRKLPLVQPLLEKAP